MTLTFPITRRTAVLGIATALAVGGATVVGLSGDNAAPAARAGTYPSIVKAADSTALASDAFPGITVDGVGKVTGTPDTLLLNLAVTKTAADVSSAITQLSGATTAVQGSLKAHGVADKDMRTSGLDVSPQYDYSNNKPTITGYTATESMSVQLRDVKAAGAVIAAAVDAGGNSLRINGLSTDLQSDGTLLNAARAAAFADAKAKATQYAQAAGRTLGAVVRVEEGAAPAAPQSYPTSYAAGDAKSAAVPIEVGSTNLSVGVTVVFAFS